MSEGSPRTARMQCGVKRGVGAPFRVMRAYHTSGHLPVAVAHAFVLTRPTRGVGTCAQAICGLILTSRRVWHCFCRRVEEPSGAYEGDREEKMPCHGRTS